MIIEMTLQRHLLNDSFVLTLNYESISTRLQNIKALVHEDIYKGSYVVKIGMFANSR